MAARRWRPTGLHRTAPRYGTRPAAAQRPQEACDTAGFSLFLVADISALGRLHGDRAQPYCLLEAGAMAHSLTTAAARLGIATCQIGTLDFRDAKKALGLGDTEKLLCTIMGGTQ